MTRLEPGPDGGERAVPTGEIEYLEAGLVLRAVGYHGAARARPAVRRGVAAPCPATGAACAPGVYVAGLGQARTHRLHRLQQGRRPGERRADPRRPRRRRATRAPRRACPACGRPAARARGRGRRPGRAGGPSTPRSGAGAAAQGRPRVKLVDVAEMLAGRAAAATRRRRRRYAAERSRTGSGRRADTESGAEAWRPARTRGPTVASRAGTGTTRERRQHLIDAAIAEIEAVEPGAEVHVQQIAQRAGVGRTVVYRHFDDRSDLDRAVQTDVVDRLASTLVEAVPLDGTVPDIIRRVVGSYVDWAVTHPSLHQLALRDSGSDGSGPLSGGPRPDRRAGPRGDRLRRRGAAPRGLRRPAGRPRAAGLRSGRGGVRRRTPLGRLAPREPAADVLVELVTDSVWFLIAGHAALPGAGAATATSRRGPAAGGGGRGCGELRVSGDAKPETPKVEALGGLERLWTPHRMRYVSAAGAGPEAAGCPFCAMREHQRRRPRGAPRRDASSRCSTCTRTTRAT